MRPQCQNCEYYLTSRDFDIGICPNCDADLEIQKEEDNSYLNNEPEELTFQNDLPFVDDYDIDDE